MGRKYDTTVCGRHRRRTIVRDGAAGYGEVDTGLEDGIITGVAVNANPRRGGVSARATGGRSRRRHGERARNRPPGALHNSRVSTPSGVTTNQTTHRARAEHGTSPIRAVLGVRDVGEFNDVGLRDELYGACQARAIRSARDAIGEAALRGSERGGCEDNEAEELGDEHGSAGYSQE